MLQLINRARLDPAGEAQRDFIDLNEGIKPTDTPITTAPKQPLAINPLLDQAATAQAAWLMANTTLSTFGHSGPGGNSPSDRISAAGYTLAGTDETRENAGINLYGSLGDLTALTEAQDKAYFVDTTNADGGRGHRLQMMDPNLKEVGVAIRTGSYGYNGTTYQGFESVIDFAEHDSVPYLTGAAYTDAVTKDNFYTPGEGIGNITVEAIRASDSKVFTTQTWASGGYTLPLEAGTYTVYGTGAGLGGTVVYGNVTVTNQNIEKDFTPAQITATPPFTLLANGVLMVNGTSGNDKITIQEKDGNYVVSKNANLSADATYAISSVTSVQVQLGDGDDVFDGRLTTNGVYVNGGTGDDSIYGGSGEDTLTGAAGKDQLFGGAGDDRINGGTKNDVIWGDDGNDRLYGGDDNDYILGVAGVDRLFGENGNDTLIGGASNDKLYGGDGNDSLLGQGQNDLLHGDAGNDTIDGGKNDDSLTGGAGNDLLIGNEGNDIIDSKDSAIDTVSGGAGTDSASYDLIDVVDTIETTI